MLVEPLTEEGEAPLGVEGVKEYASLEPISGPEMFEVKSGISAIFQGKWNSLASFL